MKNELFDKENKITTADIRIALRHKYAGDDFRQFEEYRAVNGYAPGVGYIDFLSVGLFNGKSNNKIIACEIKISRSDFKHDVDKFLDKQDCAIQISNEIYYACPHGMIEPSEVPEIAGLMYVTATRKIKIIKQAQFRIHENIPYFYLKGFVKSIASPTYQSSIPIKYLGKEMTEKDVDKIVQQRIKTQGIQYEVDRQVSKETAKIKQEQKVVNEMLTNVLRTAGGYSWWKDAAYLCNEKQLEKLTDVLDKFDRYMTNISDTKNALDRLNNSYKTFESLSITEKINEK